MRHAELPQLAMFTATPKESPRKEPCEKNFQISGAFKDECGERVLQRFGHRTLPAENSSLEAQESYSKSSFFFYRSFIFLYYFLHTLKMSTIQLLVFLRCT